jgi:hypothetical protein
MRQMREEFQKVTKAQSETIEELKMMNKQLIEKQSGTPAEALKQPEPTQQPQPVVVEEDRLADSDVSDDRQLDLARSVETYMSAYEASQQELVVTRISMPLKQIIKEPDSAKYRNVATTNSLLKPVCMTKKEQVEAFMMAIGFQKEKDTVFKYVAPGNVNELRMVVDFMKER